VDCIYGPNHLTLREFEQLTDQQRIGSKPRRSLQLPSIALALALFATRAYAIGSVPASDLLRSPVVASLLTVTPPGPLTAPEVSFGDPLPGHVVDSPFGLRRLPWEARPRLHAGVDIAAPLGTPIHALTDGIVEDFGIKAGYGRFVEIDLPSGLVTFYAHLSAPSADLKSGEAMKAGSVVGYVGSSGDATGPHLHLEVRYGGKPLNPVMFIGKTFASVAQLPLVLAAKVGRAVRIATVSHLRAKMFRQTHDVRLAFAERRRRGRAGRG